LIVAAICVRGGSKGVRRKNLLPLLGKPLMAHTIESALRCDRLDRIVVSTDDEQMAATARAYGAEVPFLRPAELARDSSPKWPVFQHLVRTLEAQQGVRIDVLADLDTGTPLRSHEDISRALDLLLSTDADVVTTAYAAERNPYFNMVEYEGDSVRVVKSAGRTITCRQDAPPVYSLTPAIFAMRRDFILRATHWSEGKLKISMMPRERSIDIDERLDFEFVEFLLGRKQGIS
jgi:CMP-N,N'-diacetyllegionaminic acid synthase